MSFSKPTMSSPTIITLGSIIIDDITHADGTISPMILGGGGTHFAYGGRLFFYKDLSLSISSNSKRIGLVAHLGFDFPENLYEQLKGLEISLEEHRHLDRHSPRAWNMFGPNEYRAFEYQYKNIRVVPSDVPVNWLGSAKLVHFIAGERALDIVEDWERLTVKNGIVREGEIYMMWEPLPPFAIAENWGKCKEIMKKISIITPNHEEAAAFLGRTTDEINLMGEDGLNWLADRFLEAGVGPEGNGCVVIRAGGRGCLIATQKIRYRIPAYWVISEGLNHPNVRDVTGAGNSFCGGFAIGLIEKDGDLLEAGLYGTVSASFTVEQVGMPRLTIGENGEEIWNEGPSPRKRLAEMRARLIP